MQNIIAIILKENIQKFMNCNISKLKFLFLKLLIFISVWLFLLIVPGCLYEVPGEALFESTVSPADTEEVSTTENPGSEIFPVSISEISVTYNSAVIVIETETENLHYVLSSEDGIVYQGIVSGILELRNLEKNTEYTLVLSKNESELTKIFKTHDTVTLRFGGDITMSDFFGDALNNYGYMYMWEDVLDLFESSDFTFFNLETSVSERGKSTKPAGFGFRSDPLHLEGFVKAGINLVNLANNHVKDYGQEAFYDTLRHLEERDIGYVGAGRNFSEALEIKFFDIKGIRVGFFGASSIIPDKSWIAAENSGGLMPLKENYYSLIKETVNNAKEECDILVANLHWGREYVNHPSGEQKRLAHELIDAGVDIIAGSHPHVLQGVEYYEDGIIFYSTGNFVFYKNNYDSGLTGLFEVEIYNSEILSARIYPVFINNLKANLLEPGTPMYNEIISNLNTRSEIFGVDVDKSGFIKRVR